MTKREFLDRIPDIIEHEVRGYGELEVVVDKPNHKGVCYRHRNKLASYGTYGHNWKEICDDLEPFLVNKGIMKMNTLP